MSHLMAAADVTYGQATTAHSCAVALQGSQTSNIVQQCRVTQLRSGQLFRAYGTAATQTRKSTVRHQQGLR